MMAGAYNFQEEEEEEEYEEFFDSREDICSTSNSCPDTCVDHLGSCTSEGLFGWSCNGVWDGKLVSVQERRNRFMKWMGLNLISSPHRDSTNLKNGEISAEDESVLDIDRITSDSGAVLRSAHLENMSFLSSWSNEIPCSSENGVSKESFHCKIKIKNLDIDTMSVMEKLGQYDARSRLHEVGSNQMVLDTEVCRSLSASPPVQHFRQRESDKSSSSNETVGRRRMGWLRKLGVATCIADREDWGSSLMFSDTDQRVRDMVCRVRVRPHKKRSIEFSAVYTAQDIKAHDGAILTMKFSPDGHYLASGGEDGIVRVWHITESERTYKDDLPKDELSSVYLTVNHNSELTLICNYKEKRTNSKGTHKKSDSACVVIPPEVFRISEQPLHEFHGHSGDILDLSWSNNKHLLSSSVDKTVRLWQVGCDSCLEVFLHNNYVTCVQFNPIDENYFISGSIDGKVRIWGISSCHVVDWADITDIVTALCYHPNGKALVVGCMAGNCHFYDLSDNHLQLDTEVSLQAKNKYPYKRITGFQFCPSDPGKLMVTSADSKVRILDGTDVIFKYKGLQNAGSQISASFTSDGRHIIAASEDSNVYLWNYLNQDGPTPNHVKSSSSWERFFSPNVSVAITWQTTESRNPIPVTAEVLTSHWKVFADPSVTSGDDQDNNTLCLSSSGSFSLGQGFLPEFLSKGSATWPEEKLPSSLVTAAPALCSSQYKLLRTACQSTATPHAWGRVIVTAGLDGRIRSFQNYGLPVKT